MSVRPARPLRPIEIAYGLAIGHDSSVRPLRRRTDLSPRAAFEHVLLDALRRPPCLISFSGGRDSSALLALAVALARREGLPLPVPATLVFPGAASADEREWQELILEHLGLEEWIRLEFTDELDAVGPVAQQVLRRHGLVWPFNLHFHLPIVEAAQGGSVVTGFAGDELARTSSTLGAERLLAERRLGRPRDILKVGYRLAPPPIRFAHDVVAARTELVHVSWLTPRGRARLQTAIAADWARMPVGWGRVLRRWMWRARYFQVCRENFAVMAEPYGVRMVHPFVEAPVLQALAHLAPFSGLGSRTRLMEVLVGDLVPDAVLRRTSKGAYTDPLWTARARRFAAEWSGRGLDERLVDPARVREAWLREDRTLLTTTMLQAAWLADHGAVPVPEIAASTPTVSG